MNAVSTWIAGALGIVVAIGILVVLLLIIGIGAFALRRRAFRRGTHPLRLLPWYLGGPPQSDGYLPAERQSARERRRKR